MVCCICLLWKKNHCICNELRVSKWSQSLHQYLQVLSSDFPIVFSISVQKRSRKLLGKEWGTKKLHYYLHLVMVKWIIEQRKFAASGLDEKLSKLFGRYSVKFLEELPNMVHFVSKFSWHPIKGRGIVNWVRNDIGLECHDICLECKFKKLLPHCEMQLRIVGRF